MKHGLWCVCVYVCVLVDFLVSHWMRVRAMVRVGQPSPNNNPSSGHAPCSPSTTHAIIHTLTHIYRSMPVDQPPCRAPSTQKWGRNWSGHSLRRAHGTAAEGTAKRMKAGGKEKTFHFLPSMRKNKKSDSYSNYPATRRDNSKRELSVEEVQCSSLGTKDSSPKQCCCLWASWEPSFRKLWRLFKSSFLLYYPRKKTLDMWPCLSSSVWFLWMSRIQIQAPSRKHSSFLSLTKVFPWSTPNSFIALEPWDQKLLPHSWWQQPHMDLYVHMCVCVRGSGGCVKVIGKKQGGERKLKRELNKMCVWATNAERF